MGNGLWCNGESGNFEYFKHCKCIVWSSTEFLISHGSRQKHDGVR